MSLASPTDCLAHYLNRPFTTARDMGFMPCSAVAARLKAYETSTNDHKVPEAEALAFYGMNHGMALISARFDQFEPLPDWERKFVDQYYRDMSVASVRAFYYLLLICTREARHNKNINAMNGHFPEHLIAFFKGTNGGEAGIHKKFVSEPPNATIGEYCTALCHQFYKGSWNPGYGGKAWGAVADCLRRFVVGEFTAEMMMDTVWTLSHNNGPIFNKGIFYGLYNGAALLRILDIQRSGQIPQAVLSDKIVAQYLPSGLTKTMTDLRARFPDDIGAYVDWEVVQALGAVGNYPSDIKEQHAKYGMSPAAKAAKEAAELAAKAQAEAVAKAKAEFLKNHYEVMPDHVVKIIHRAA